MNDVTKLQEELAKIKRAPRQRTSTTRRKAIKRKATKVVR